MKLFLLLFFVVPLSGCSYFRTHYTQSPKVTLAETRLEEVQADRAKIILVLDVENPNDADINLDEVSYELSLDNKPFSKSKTDKKYKILAHGSTMVEIPLPIEYSQIWNGVKKMLLGEDLSYAVNGEAKLALFTIPFKKEGKLDLFKPE